MKKNVEIMIRNVQSGPHAEAEPMEIVCDGEYYFRGGKHYILYEEEQKDFASSVHSRLKIGPDRVEVNKKGPANVLMVFDKTKDSRSHYQTPYGRFFLGISTRELELSEQEDAIDVHLIYGLEIDGEPHADCEMDIRVRPKE